MPIFEYQCNACKTEFEKLVFTSDRNKIICPGCKSREVTKKMSATTSVAGSSGSCSGSSPAPFS